MNHPKDSMESKGPRAFFVAEFGCFIQYILHSESVDG